jgi:hypothetical protein
MQTPRPDPKKLTLAERDKAIDAFCAEVDQLLGLPPPTQADLDRAMAESTKLVMFPRHPEHSPDSSL